MPRLPLTWLDRASELAVADPGENRRGFSLASLPPSPIFGRPARRGCCSQMQKRHIPFFFSFFFLSPPLTYDCDATGRGQKEKVRLSNSFFFFFLFLFFFFFSFLGSSSLRAQKRNREWLSSRCGGSPFSSFFYFFFFSPFSSARQC